jgi:hypothetical protein
MRVSAREGRERMGTYDADTRTKCSWREVYPEFRLDDPRAPMRTCNPPTPTISSPSPRNTARNKKHAPPDNPYLRPMDLPLCAVYIRNPFTEVVLGVLFASDAFDLDKGGIGTRVALCALVAQDAAFAVESVDKSWLADESKTRLSK